MRVVTLHDFLTYGVPLCLRTCNSRLRYTCEKRKGGCGCTFASNCQEAVDRLPPIVAETFDIVNVGFLTFTRRLATKLLSHASSGGGFSAFRRQLEQQHKREFFRQQVGMDITIHTPWGQA